MRHTTIYSSLSIVVICLLCIGRERCVDARTDESVTYWRTTYGELLPAEDPRVARAQAILARLIQAAGKPTRGEPRLLVTKREPWGIVLPLALPDRWIVLSKRTLDLCYHHPGYGEHRLAFLLGHELAHYTAGHFVHLYAVRALIQASAAAPTERRSQLAALQQRLETTDDAWGQEMKADQDGMLYTVLAGFDPQALIAGDPAGNFFEEWLQLQGLERGGAQQATGTHPPATQRDTMLRVHMQHLLAKSALFELGLWFTYAGNYAKAIDAFEQFRTEFPSREVMHNLASSHHQLALQIYRLWKNEPALPFSLPMLFDPVTRASTVARLRPRSGVLPPVVPSVAFREHLEAAIELYREALGLDETYTPAAINLGNALLVHGVHGEGGAQSADLYDAVAILQRALAFAPKVPELLNTLGVAYFYVDNSAKAQDLLTRARSLAPAYASPVFNLASLARLEKRHEEAHRYQGLYEQLAPSSSETQAECSAPGAAQPPRDCNHASCHGLPGCQALRCCPSERVHSLAIGSLLEEVPTEWQERLWSDLQIDGKAFQLVTYENGVKLLSRDGEVLMIAVPEGLREATARGITSGSQADKVQARYGPPSRQVMTPSGTTWVYDHSRIAFHLREGRVVSWLVY